jgi:hypothetical protein
VTEASGSLVRVPRNGDSAGVQAVTRVSAEQDLYELSKSSTISRHSSFSVTLGFRSGLEAHFVLRPKSWEAGVKWLSRPAAALGNLSIACRRRNGLEQVGSLSWNVREPAARARGTCAARIGWVRRGLARGQGGHGAVGRPCGNAVVLR